VKYIILGIILILAGCFVYATDNGWDIEPMVNFVIGVMFVLAFIGLGICFVSAVL